MDDLLLLSLDPLTGELRRRPYIDAALGGAILSELSMAGRIQVRQGAIFGRQNLVELLNPTPLGDPDLDDALNSIGWRRVTAADIWVIRLGSGLLIKRLHRLASAGMVDHQERRRFGIFSIDTWRPTNQSYINTVTGCLTQYVVAPAPNPAATDRRTAALVALLYACGALPEVLPGSQPSAYSEAG